MRIVPTEAFIALLAPVLFFAASTRAEEKADSKTAKRYESPKAVFDAYREARATGDLRKVFSLYTPEAQNCAVFETFFACMEREGTEMITGHRKEAEAIGSLVGKYLDAGTLNDDYEKEYKKKHGIDIKKLAAENNDDRGSASSPPLDDKLWQDTVAAHVKDKAEFCEAVAKYFHERDVKAPRERRVPPLGALEDLSVKGDSATGRAATTGFHYDSAPGKTPRKVEDKIYRIFEFRRVNGGWLIDSL